MSNGYVLADANSLVYAYRAGGQNLLDTYLDVAEDQDRRLAITETVLGEIEKGPLGKDLLQYIRDRQIPVLSAPETEQRLREGTLPPTSSGEVSMLEVAAREQEAGRVTRIWSDDKYFDSDQIMRKRPDAHRSMSSELLDEAYEQKFIDAAEHQRFRAGYMGQPVFVDSARLSAFQYDFPAPEIDAPHRLRPGHVQAGRALGIAGIALEVYDGAESLRTAHRLSGEGNRTAAESELIHFGARSVGGWAGAGIGMTAGAAAGVESGPGLLVTGAIGGVAGVFAGEKIAEWNDNRGIYNQMLGDNTWTYDPDHAALGWRRAAPIDSTDDNIDNARRGDLRASPATENALNYQATSRSVELVLGGPPAQRDPFALPADASDAPSSQPTNWERDPDSGHWERKVYGPFAERGMTPYSTETADAVRAERLDRQAAQIVVENAANSPASIAARYEDAYLRNGWQAHGDMPEAVRSQRTDIDTLVASDDERYQRQADGRWANDNIIDRVSGSHVATGRLHDELEATREVLQARLPPPREIPSVPPMDADARLRDTVAGAYRNAGFDASAEQVTAASVAVRATWDAYGLDPATTALQARPQTDGRFELASLRLDADGKTYAIAAVTTPEEIERARTRTETAPHAIGRPSEPDARSDDTSKAPSPHDRVEPVAASTPILPARYSDPRDPDHPDHRLYQQIERGVAGLDAERGRAFDAASERLAMGAFHDTKAAGITSADHIAINDTGKRQQDGTQIAAGTLLFVVQAQDPSDPMARRSMTDVAQAVERPVEQSLQRVDTLAQQQAQTMGQAQEAPLIEAPGRAARVA